MTRETIPHGWPQDIELRSARDVEYDPQSGLLRIGPDTGGGGKAKAVPVAPAESIAVVWVPDYVSAQPCPEPPPDSLLLVAARDSIRAYTTPRAGEADAPKVVFAAVEVPAACAELSDPQWVAEHSARWLPTDEQKRHRRVLAGGLASARGMAPHPVLSSPAQLEQHYAQARRPLPGIERIDFQTHAAVALGQGSPRLQYVHPEAIETQQVWTVDVPLTTTACRKRQAEGLSKLVYLADDTGLERGRYRVEGSPLFVRPMDALRHELRFAKCEVVFPRWRPTTTHVQPNPSMYLQLYGPTPAKERKYQDQIVTTLAVTEVGDTFNLAIPLLTPITCPESGGAPKPLARALTEAHRVRRAVLRRRLQIPYHDGPIRLVPPDRTPYDAVEWDLDVEPCSRASPR